MYEDKMAHRNDFLSAISPDLREQFFFDTYGNILKNFSDWCEKDFSSGMLKMICSVAEASFYGPGETVFSHNSIADCC